ncbi:MAG: branched-chain amino acid transport system substrate-binding protein [Motiliproteus sp.]|jgi:branched-chain amino acid transport system substrate-binding protein
MRIRKLLGCLALSLSVQSAAVLAEEPIRIGTFLAITGPASFLGDPELKTLTMAIEEINAAGGVLGRPLELVHYDSQGAAAKARTFVKRLINSDGVDVIVGGSASGETMAVIPLVEKAGVPFVSLAGAVSIIDPVKHWVFKTPHTDRMAARKIFEHMQANEISKIALISGTGGFGASGNQQSHEVAKDYGIEILVSESYGPKDSDMTAQLTKIKNTAGVQAVLNFGFGQGPAIVTKNVKQLAIEVPLYQSHGVASKKFIELAGDASEGVRLPASALLLAEQLPDDDSQKQVIVTYKQKYEQRYNSDVSTFGGHALDGLMLVVNAMENAGTVDKEAVRTALEQTQGYIGTGGEVNMSAEDHLGLNLSAFKMLEIKDGSWKTLN